MLNPRHKGRFLSGLEPILIGQTPCRPVAKNRQHAVISMFYQHN
jgi:hypothetical protein